MVAVQFASVGQFFQEIFNLVGQKITPIHYIAVSFNLSQEFFRVGTYICIISSNGKHNLPRLNNDSLLFG